MFNYSLKPTDYTWENALLWGNFYKHCKKSQEGHLQDRIIHGLIAAAEFLPIISQISSIAEMIIVNNFHINAQNPDNLKNKSVTKIAEEDKNPLPKDQTKKISALPGDTPDKKASLSTEIPPQEGNSRAALPQNQTQQPPAIPAATLDTSPLSTEILRQEGNSSAALPKEHAQQPPLDSVNSKQDVPKTLSTLIDQAKMPPELARACQCLCKYPFYKGAKAVFSIDQNQFSVRIDKPRNSGTLLILNQKEGSDEIEVTACMNDYNDNLLRHLNFFKFFAELSDIPLIVDNSNFETELKVGFKVKDEKKFELLGKAIHLLNDNVPKIKNGSGLSNFEILKVVFFRRNVKMNERTPEMVSTIDKFTNCLWKYFELTNMLPVGFTDDEVLYTIVDYLKRTNQIEQFSKKIELGLETNLLKRDAYDDLWSLSFIAIDSLPIETARKIAWKELSENSYKIELEWIPETIREELLTKLFYESPPEKALGYEESYDLFCRLMDEKLRNAGICTDAEAKLFGTLALHYKGELPENWRQKLINLVKSPTLNIFSIDQQRDLMMLVMRFS